MSSVIGFICDANENTVKIFDMKTKMLQNVESNPYNLPILGEFYEVEEDGDFEPLQSSSFQSPSFSVEINDMKRRVSVTTVAVTAPRPNIDAPEYEKEILERQRGCVWSPLLGYLEDNQRIFGREIQDGIGYLVNVEFNPETDVFEVTGINQLPENYQPPSNVDFPWQKEIRLCQKEESLYKPSEKAPRFRRGHTNHHPQFEGLVMVQNRWNPHYNPVHHNSPKRVCYVYNNELGVIRGRVGPKAGEWFRFEVNSKNLKDKSPETNEYVFQINMATRMEKIEPRHGTIVYKNVVKLTVSFVFRESKFSKSPCYFYGPDIGKVRVDLETRKEILEIIRNYRSKSPKNHQEGFVITVDVTATDIISILTVHPELPAFHTMKLLKITTIDRKIVIFQ